MRLILDTHAALWWLADDRRMGAQAALQLDDKTNEVLLSAAVVWEVAIKRGLGKLAAPDGLAETLLAGGAVPLPMTVEHAAAVESLPWHHRDPFDRILVAQTRAEGASLISADDAFRAYGVPLLW